MPDLTIIKNLPDVILLDEGAKIKISANNPFVAGTKARIELLFAGNHAYTNESFSLNWKGSSIEFTFVTAPDDSGQQLTDNDGLDTTVNFVNYLVDELRQNYYISRDFILTASHSGTSKIEFVARTEGEIYSISLVNSDVSGLTASGIVAGTDKTMLDYYRIVVEACIAGTEDWLSEVAGTDAIAPDSDFVSSFDIASYFSKYLSTGFTMRPSVNVITQQHAVKRIFFRYAEMYGGVIRKVRSTFDTPKLIIPGGLSRKDRQFYKESGTDYFSHSNNSKRFLTWQPTTKKTRRELKERLAFLFLEDIFASLKIDYKTDDGGSHTLEQDSISYHSNTVVELAIGANEISWPLAHNVVEYTVYLIDDKDNQLSEKRTYQIDDNYYVQARQFIFRNSFNHFDTLYTKGEFELSGNYNRTEMSTLDEDEFTAHLSTLKAFDNEETLTWKANTGHISKVYMEYLREFLLSDEIWEVREDMLIPVILTSKKTQLSTDQPSLYALSFEYKEAWTNTHYSSENIEFAIKYLLKDGLKMMKDGQYLRY